MNSSATDKTDHENARSILHEAMQRHQRGDLYAAELLYRRSLELEPDNCQALRLRGILARERGELDLSLELLRAAQAAQPDNPEPHGELAITLMAAGEPDQAETILRRALESAPEATRILANLGALLQHRGHLHAAIELYERLLSIDAADVGSRCNLSKALADAGRFDEAFRQCDLAEQLGNSHPVALATRGAVLTDQKDYAAARSVLEKALTQQHDDMACVNLALACYELNDIATAAEVLQHAVSINPWNARAVADLANCFCALTDPGSALDLCEGFLRQNPGERLVLGAYALALNNAGQTEAAHELTDAETLVQIIDLDRSIEHRDIGELNAQLAQWLLSAPSLIDNPISKSTNGGAQTGELNLDEAGSPNGFKTLLHDAVSNALDAYVRAGLESHPLMAPAADDWSLRMWGTVLQAGGQQTPHMHPLGWLSAVYYVSLPHDMSDTDPRAGWLEFGRPPKRFYCQSSPPTRSIEPREGRLILFPSWFWHQTVPFRSSAPRISIAFDVAPKSMLRIL